MSGAYPCFSTSACGNLEAPERLDLPLRRAVPDRVRAPQHVVGAEGVDDLAEQVGAGGGIGRDQLPEGGAQLHVDVREARLLLLHLAELGGPGHLRRTGLVADDAEQPGVVDEEVDVREILRRLDQVARMVVVRDRARAAGPCARRRADPELARAFSSIG